MTVVDIDIDISGADLEAMADKLPGLIQASNEKARKETEFDKDLGIAMVEGLHGYDPYNNVGKAIVGEMIGVQ